MPDIRLQDYAAEIKDLIRTERHDEAIAHCQHILKKYPKCVKVYSLLGEACLEKGAYREAIEFFQRTLSADPESFIARVGLGIIYDEQGSLPEAIWQMERAFELAPGNAEVRRELQRLYTQRDGSEKARLKLTRGALGRLYVRNGLYERAIGEFRAVLHQEPSLPDVRVALLEALWREGRRLEAVESCLDLLDELPNCLKANLILGEIWTQSGHEDEGEEKLKLANALDPENQVAQELMGADSPLSAQEVTIPQLEIVSEELSLVPQAEETITPAGWDDVTAAGVIAELAEREIEVEEWKPDEESSSWLSEIAESAEEAVPTADEPRVPEPEAQANEAAEEQIPGWLQGSVEEEPPFPEAEEPSTEAAPAEAIPGWLQELVGEDGVPLAEAMDEEELSSAEGPGMVLPASIAALVAAGKLSEEDAESAATEAPDEELEAAGEVPAAAEDLPKWLRELEAEAEEPATEGEEPPEVEEIPTAEELPQWLRELEPEAEEPTAPVAEAPEIEEIPEAEEVPTAEELPHWLRDLAPKAEEPAAPVAEAPEVKETPAAESPDEGGLPPAVPASIAALAAAGLLSEDDADSAMSEEELEGQQVEEVPDWLLDLERKTEEPAAPVAEAPEVEEIPEAEEVPDWLRDLAPKAEEPAAPVAEAPEVEEIPEAEEVPDWLRDLAPKAEEPAAPVAAGPEVEEAPAAKAPDEGGLSAAVPASIAALAAAGLLSEDDADSAMSEMSEEELEAQQAEEVPDWLRELEPEAGEPAAPVAEAPEVEEAPAAEEFATAEEMPQWLRELEPEAGEPAAPVAEAPEVEEVPAAEEVPTAEELPQWLRELKPEAEEPAAPVAEVTEGEETPETEEVLDWLSELAPKAEEPAAPVAEAPEVEEAPAAEAPDEGGLPAGVPASMAALVAAGLLSQDDVDSAMSEMSEEELDAQQVEEVPDWLRDLAPEDEEVAAPAEAGVVDEVAEEVPDWLRDLAPEAEESAAAAAAAVEKVDEEVPDWLRELVPDEEEVTEDTVRARAIEKTSIPEEDATEELPAIEEAGAADLPAAEEVPDWLRDLAPDEEEVVAPEAEAPATEGVTVAGEKVAAEELPVEDEVLAAEELLAEEEIPPPEEIPDWLRELGPARDLTLDEEEIVEPTAEELVAEATEDEVPTARVPASMAALVAAGLLSKDDVDTAMTEMSEEDLKAQQTEEVPDWLLELAEGEAPVVPPPAETAVEEAPVAEAPAVEAPAEEAQAGEEVAPPTWQPVAEQDEIPTPVAGIPLDEVLAVAEEPKVEEPAAEPALDEVEVVATELEEAPAAADTDEEVSVAEEVPAWARDLGPSEEEVTAPADEAPEIEEAPAAAAAGVAKEVPDWVRDWEPEEEEVAAQVTEGAVAEEAPAAVDAPVAEETPVAEEVPAWARDLGPADEEAVARVAEAPVSEAEAETAVETPVAEAEAPEPEVPESLQALVAAGLLDEADLESAMTEMSAEELMSQRSEMVPDWLAELAGDEEAAAALVAASQAVEGLAPAEEPEVAEDLPPIEEPLVSEEIPTEAALEAETPPGAEVPDWIQELVDDEKAPVREASLPTVGEPLPAAELPDWVHERDTPEEQTTTAPPAEEAVAEEAVVTDDVVEEAVAEQAIAEEATVEAVVEEAAAEEAIVEETVAEEAVIEEAPAVRESEGPSRLEELQARLKAHPRDADSRLELARLYRDQGNWDATLDQYERLVTARKHLPDAIEDMKALTGQDVDRARLYQLLGDAYMQDNHLDEALEMYRQARQALTRR